MVCKSMSQEHGGFGHQMNLFSEDKVVRQKLPTLNIVVHHRCADPRIPSHHTCSRITGIHSSGTESCFECSKYLTTSFSPLSGHSLQGMDWKRKSKSVAVSTSDVGRDWWRLLRWRVCPHTSIKKLRVSWMVVWFGVLEGFEPASSQKPPDISLAFLGERRTDNLD